MSGVALNGDQHTAAGSSPPGGPVIVCAHCGKQSSGSTRFCGGCGARLWEPCPACGSVNAIDLKFCGGCGVSLDEALMAARSEAVRLIEEAEKKAEQGRFVDAIRMLEGLKLVEHTGLVDLQEEARQRAADCAQQREEVASSAGQVLEEARALAEQGLILQAYRSAKQVPPALRGLELRSLCDELEAKVDELKRLRTQVQEGLSAKDYAGIYPAVKRLLEIDPGDEKMAKLANKLESKRSKLDRSDTRKRLKSALAALKKCDYRAAEAALAQAPDGDLDEKTTKALVGARERVWLALQMARSPFADEALLAVADRLAKLQPHDEKVAQLRVEVMRRWKEGLRKHPGEPVEWSKSTATEDGLRIEPACCSAGLAKILTKKGYAPGQFLVAYGLALQAADRAEHDIDLAPKRKGWAARFSFRKGKKKGDTAAWGIDIGSHSIKAVRLIAPEDGGAAVIDDVCFVPTRGEDQEQDDAKEEGTLSSASAAAVECFLSENDLAGTRVAIGMSGTLTLGRFFKLPWLSQSKFEEAIRYEARMRIPLDPEDVQFDYAETEISPAKEGEEDGDGAEAAEFEDAKVMRVALVGATRAHVEERLALFSEAGADSIEVTSDCVALANAHAARLHEVGKKQDQAVAIICIGAKTTSVAILSDQGCWFRGSYYGGESYDQEVLKTFKCSWQRAEEMRRKPSKAAWMYQVDEALQPLFEGAVELIERTLAQYHNEEGRPVKHVLLCGGGAEQFGLLRYLRTGQ